VNNWKVIPTIVVATVLIFGAGVFTGGLLVNQIQKAGHKAAHKPATTAAEVHPPATNLPVASPSASTNEPPKVRPPEILNKRFLQQLDAELVLKPAQRDAIQKIIDDGQNQIRKAIQDARLEIRDVLTPAQQVQFDCLMKHPFHKPIFSTNASPAVLTTTNLPAAKP
jgi:hypothetical protein